MVEVLLIILAYLIGSIPTAVWISKYFFDIDIREYGSGNAGATNTFRVLGSKWGSLVMAVDVIKGVIATSLYVLIPYYLHDEFDRTNFMVGLGLAAVMGHIFPVWAEFRGGKGGSDLIRDDSCDPASCSCMLYWNFYTGTLFNSLCFIKFYFGKHCFCNPHTLYF